MLWNGTENGPRAFWRLLGACGGMFIGVFILPSVLFGGAELPVSVAGVAVSLTSALVILTMAVVSARDIDRRPLVAYGLDFSPLWLKEFTVGSLVALVGIAVALLVNLLAGWATVSELVSRGAGANTLPFALSFGVYTAQWLLTAFWEELMFRGLVLTNAVEPLRSSRISDRGAVVAGVVVSSVIFTVLYFPGLIGAFGFRMILGVLLGAAYVWANSLALPIGLHIMTNFAMNTIYGLTNVFKPGAQAAMLIRLTYTGPSEFVQLYGIVNAGVVLCVVAFTCGYVLLRNSDFSSEFSSTYIQKPSSE